MQGTFVEICGINKRPIVVRAYYWSADLAQVCDLPCPEYSVVPIMLQSLTAVFASARLAAA